MTLALASGAHARAATTTQFMAVARTATVVSDDGPTAVRFLNELAQARALMQSVVAVDSLPPVRAFAVRNEASLRELVPQYWERRGTRPHAASFTGPHAAFIAIRTDVPARQQFPLLLHEYVHLLTTAHVPDAPAWLDEGLSEFWGALAIDGQQVVAGRPPDRHLKLLQTREWLTLDEMQQHQRGTLAADHAQAAMFYAQSWAAVHYLLMGQGPSVSLSFAPSTRDLTPQLDAAIRAYVKKGEFREVVSGGVDVASGRADVVSGFSRTVAAAIPLPISEARALAEKANMVVFGERPDAALPLLRRALALDPAEPFAVEVMGTYFFLRNQPGQAREWLERAFTIGSGSSTAALYLSLLSSSAPERERYLQSAVRLRPDLEVAWQRLWALYAEDGRVERARRWCHRLKDMGRSFLWDATAWRWCSEVAP